MKQIASILFFALILISSCSKDEGPFYVGTTDPNLDTIQVSYANQVQPIFNFYCISCHSITHDKLILVQDQSYNQLLTDGAKAPYVTPSDPEASIIMGYLNGQPISMPPSGSIPEFEKQILLKWIKDGAKNN